MQTFTIANLRITAVGGVAGRICYVLYPRAALGEWIEQAAQKYGVSIAVVTGMDWDDDLTPWPAPGQPPGSPAFRGLAQTFLTTLTTRVVPEVEGRLGIAAGAERTLAGVSLSGLFTLWQWMLGDTFRNIISLSGSYWYDGFVDWIKSRPVPPKTGRAYFLLGNQEAHTRVKAFQCVQIVTTAIVTRLHAHGIDDTLDIVPGDHYQNPIPRLDRAFAWMFGVTCNQR